MKRSSSEQGGRREGIVFSIACIISDVTGGAAPVVVVLLVMHRRCPHMTQKLLARVQTICTVWVRIQGDVSHKELDKYCKAMLRVCGGGGRRIRRQC